MKYILFLSIFIYSCISFAQTSFKKRETYTINISELEQDIRVEVLVKKVNVKTNKNLTYHWYTPNKIIQTEGGYDGKLLDGDYNCFYSNNSLKEKGHFKKGLKKGEWIEWFEKNNKIKSVSHWKNGVKHGLFISYDEKGAVLSEQRFKKGKEIVYPPKRTFSEKRKAFSSKIKKLFKKKAKNPIPLS